ncbi:Kelch repeat-containing protein [Streptomyces sp. NPDC012508]|uniref:Kelch repeat-containing protein n=1 Tax=Streptomyces sp. NPDC012508 TaxID=3364837 RepID=UPI0036CB88BC
MLAIAPLVALTAGSATAQGVWVSVPSMPTGRAALGSTAAHCPEGLLDTCVYAIGGGGVTGIAPFEAYSPSTNAWATLPQMTTPRVSVASSTAPCPEGVRGDCVYAVGGTAAAGPALATAEAYSTDTNTWLTLPDLPTARAGAAAATAPCAEGLGLRGTCVYVFGGSDLVNPIHTTVEAYSPETNTWATVTPLQTARVGLAGAAGPCPTGLGLKGTCVYALGGASNTAGALSSAEVYSPVLNAWTYLPEMPTGRDDGPGAAYAPCPEGLSNGCVYVMGGLDDTFTTSDTMEAYSPVANTWVSLPSMPTPHREMGAAAAPCPRNAKRDCVYALAGYVDGANIAGTAEAFAIERAEVTQPKPAPTPTPTSKPTATPTPASKPTATPTSAPKPDSRPDSRPKETPAQGPAKTAGSRIQVTAPAQAPEPAASSSPSASPAKPAPAATPAPAAKPAPADTPASAGTPTPKPTPTAKPSPKPTPPVTTIGMRP